MRFRAPEPEAPSSNIPTTTRYATGSFSFSAKRELRRLHDRSAESCVFRKEFLPQCLSVSESVEAWPSGRAEKGKRRSSPQEGREKAAARHGRKNMVGTGCKTGDLLGPAATQGVDLNLQERRSVLFVNENSPLSGEFQKGEVHIYPQKALLNKQRSATMEERSPEHTRRNCKYHIVFCPQVQT